jgi:hypothetical protein
MSAQVAADSPWLPLVLVRGDGRASPDASAATAALLSDGSALTAVDSPGLPAVLQMRQGSVFPGLFRKTLQVITARLAGNAALSGQFRRDGAELLRFLALSLTPRSARIVDEHDAASLALFCCVCEGLMHCGCCPSAFEGRAKRAAHVCLALSKKALLHADVHQRASVFVLVWAALILAQSTEGILDAPLPSESERADSAFQWSVDGQNAIHHVYHSLKPDAFVIVPGTSTKVGHPFRRLDAEGATGLTLTVDGVPLTPVSTGGAEPIARARMWGVRRTLLCVLGAEPVLEWTNVVQVFASTVYRIDVLTPLAGPLGIEAALVAECPGPVREVGPGRYLFAGHENTIIEFPDDPWEWRPGAWTGRGTVGFLPSRPCRLIAPTHLTTAWASGRSVTSVNRTNLLGLHA